MAILTKAKRAQLAASQFAGPGQSFPVNDPTHQKLAISGATRSFNAGNISKSTETKIKSKAKRLLASRNSHPHAKRLGKFLHPKKG